MPFHSNDDRQPRILVAPDKFKGSLTAAQATAAISLGVRDVVPDAEVTAIPVSDGREGTTGALAHTGAETHTLHVRGPMGDQVTARWASIAETGRQLLLCATAHAGPESSRPTRSPKPPHRFTIR
jgi:glycerate kinase